MKAVVIEEPKKMVIKEIEKPIIKNDDDVIVKIISGGICGSDIGIYTGTNALATYPRIVGHEFGGIVEEIGKEVKNVKVGDLVAVDNVNSCKNCYACKSNHHNVCKSVEVSGVHRDGGFAEFMKTKAENCYKVDKTKFDPIYIATVEPYSIGMEVCERVNINENDNVLVMGAGPIGQTVIEIAKVMGAKKVIATDINDERLKMAKQNGADVVVNVKNENLQEILKSVTNDDGANVVVDSVCIGNSMVEALDNASEAGRVVFLSVGGNDVVVKPVQFSKKGLTIYASRLNLHRFPKVIKWFEEGKLNPKNIVTHIFNYIESEKAFNMIINKTDNPGKILLTF